MKTNTGLVEYAKAQLGKPYWFGTFGQVSTEKLWNDKAKQYPKYYSDTRKKKAIHAQCGVKVHDCAGLIKGYMWSSSNDAAAIYKADQDWSADTMYSKATVKGTIKTIPEKPGVLVWRKGHIGVYIGGGEVIEAKGFDYGVVKSKLAGSTFTHWLEYSLITYETTQKAPELPVTAPDVKADTVYTVKKGDTLNAISRSYGVTVAQICSWNNIQNANLIRVGQKLTIKNAPEAPQQVQGNWFQVNTQQDALNVRRAPGGEILTILPKGYKVEVESISNGWAKLKNRPGYVSAAYLKKI